MCGCDVQISIAETITIISHTPPSDRMSYAECAAARARVITTSSALAVGTTGRATIHHARVAERRLYRWYDAPYLVNVGMPSVNVSRTV